MTRAGAAALIEHEPHLAQITVQLKSSASNICTINDLRATSHTPKRRVYKSEQCSYYARTRESRAATGELLVLHERRSLDRRFEKLEFSAAD